MLRRQQYKHFMWRWEGAAVEGANPAQVTVLPSDMRLGGARASYLRSPVPHSASHMYKPGKGKT